MWRATRIYQGGVGWAGWVLDGLRSGTVSAQVNSTLCCLLCVVNLPSCPFTALRALGTAWGHGAEGGKLRACSWLQPFRRNPSDAARVPSHFAGLQIPLGEGLEICLTAISSGMKQRQRLPTGLRFMLERASLCVSLLTAKTPRSMKDWLELKHP